MKKIDELIATEVTEEMIFHHHPTLKLVGTLLPTIHINASIPYIDFHTSLETLKRKLEQYHAN